MSEQENGKKNRTRRLLWAGFAILVLVVGLGPLFMLIAYTRDINLIEYLRSRTEKEVEGDPDLLPAEPYMVQYIYRYCDHGSVCGPDSIPAGLAEPPPLLVEMVMALRDHDADVQDIMSHLKDTAGWYIADIGAGLGGPYFTFTHLGDLCPDCEQHFYLGVFHDEGEEGPDLIAVYQGRPPGGKVIRVTGFKVRDDLRERLEAGVVFDSWADLDSVLEAYTS